MIKELGILVTGKDQASGVIHGITGTLGNLAKVGIGAVVAGFGAIAGGIASTIGPAADFQSQVALMGIASKETGAALDALDDAAIKVGGDSKLVGVDAAMAAEAMTNLYKAGLDTGEMFGDMQGYMAGTAELGGALRASIDLAAASELDMAQASDIVAIAMATFGLNAEEAMNIANNFVQTADASVTSVSELAGAMVNVGPTAAAFGWSMEDVNIALAILSERGIKGAEAGTALKSMMTNMMRPTVAVTSTLEKLNVSLYDQHGALKTLPEIMEEVGKGMAKLTEEERNQAVQALAGTYGMKAMNTLLAEGVEGWNGMEAAIADAATAQEVSAAIAETFNGKMEAMSGVVDTLKIGIGSHFLPVFGDLVGVFTSFLEDNAQGIEDFFGGIADWLGENIPKGIEKLESIWNKVIPAARDTGIKFYEGIKPGLEWLKAQFDKFTTAVLPGLKAAWDTVSKGWNEIKDLVNTHLKPAIDELAKSLGIGKGKTDEIGTSFGQFIGWIISTGVKGIIEGIKLAVEGLSFAFDQGKKFVDNIKRAFESLKDAIQWVKDRINELKDAFNGIKDSLPDWLVPGSPTPFEIGLRGIARAIKAMPGLSFSFKGENSTFDPGRFNPGGGAIIIHNHFGKDSVRSDKDVFDLANQIARSVRLRGGAVVIA